jgi:hypothetical protein
MLSAASIAVAEQRPAFSAEYLREAERVARMLEEIQLTGWLPYLSIDATANSWERMADRAALYSWGEIDALDDATQSLWISSAHTLEGAL